MNFISMKLKTIIINDNIDEFKTIKSDETSKSISFVMQHNTGNIFQYVIKNFSISCYNLFQLINRIDRENENIYIKLIFDILFYNYFTDEEYGEIINKTVSKKIWNIVDYLHILGHKTNDLQLLLDKYPKDRFRDLQFYGYDLREPMLIYNIKKCKNININELSIEFIQKYKVDILKNLKYNYLKELHQNKLIELNKNDMIIACENLNVSALLYYIENNYSINNAMIDVLFCVKKNVLTKRNKNKFRNRRYIISKIYNKKIPYDYENNMVKLLDKLHNNNQKILIKNITWRFLFSHNFLQIIDKLYLLGFKPNINSFFVYRNIRTAIFEDNLSTIKKYIELNMIKPNKISTNSKLLDIAILNKSEKVSNFFINNLRMKCSKSILIDFINSCKNTKRNKIKFIDLVMLLESNDYPINDSVLTHACKIGNKQVIEYMIENKKIKPTTKQLEYLLLRRKYNLISYMLSKGVKIHKKNMIDRLLNYIVKNFISYKACFTLIKYVHKKYGATASKKSINLCFKLKSYKILDYISNEFNLTCEHIPNTNICKKLFSSRRLYTKYKTTNINGTNFIKYVVDNYQKLKINLTNELKSMMIYHAIQHSGKKDILEYLVDKFDYKLKIQDIHDILEFHNLDGLKVMMKQGIEITEELINEIISCSALKFIQVLHEEYKIDIKKFISLKQLHLYIVSYYLYNIMLQYLIDNIGIEITPYTLELYCTVQNNLFRNEIIIFLINRLNKKITPECKNILLRLIEKEKQYPNRFTRKRNKQLLNIINQCKIIQYQPSIDEIVPVHNLLHDNIDDEIIENFELNIADDFIEGLEPNIEDNDDNIDNIIDIFDLGPELDDKIIIKDHNK